MKREKPFITRQWLNSDKQLSSSIITVCYDHSARIELSDCSNSVSIHAYTLDTAKERSEYLKKIRIIQSAVTTHLDEVVRRWQ